MSEFVKHLQANPIVLGLALLVLILFVHFVTQYVARGVRLRSRLMALARNVRAVDSKSPGQLKVELSNIFRGTPGEFAWSEFEETLHEQYSYFAGERKISAIRATSPAEAFVSLDTLVDPKLGSEYFKHLPGILTGLGIIGTFTGLIQGLMHFDPSISDTARLTSNLAALFQYVRDAFTFSGLAIGLAILITFIEKWLYSSCAKWVGELSQALDGLFRAGVGEEYLSGLLQASQENATQVRQLKEAMVEDLKVLLTNLTERQILATQQLSADLGQQIQQSLQEPLSEIAKTVRQASGQQTEVAGRVLENLMASFLEQMRESTGGQLKEVTALLQQTGAAISNVELAMKSLVADMQRAGSDSTSGVQEAVRQLMASLADHQQKQGDTVASASAAVFTGMQEALARIAAVQEEGSRKSEASNLLVSAELKKRIEMIGSANAATLDATQGAISRIGAVSTAAIEGMTSGAKAVSVAVTALQGAAERMGRVSMEMSSLEAQTQKSASSVAMASGQLAVAAQSLSTSITQLGTTSTRLEAVAQAATTEAATRSQILRDLQEVMKQSQAASAEFATLTAEVERALKGGLETFGTGVSKVLSEHLASYQKQLGDAVGMLQGALEELAEYASESRS